MRLGKRFSEFSKAFLACFHAEAIKKPSPKAEEKLKTTCKHNGRFEVRGTNTIGFATCLECGAQAHIAFLLDNTAKRLQRLEAKYDQRPRKQTRRSKSPKDRKRP